MFMLRVISVLKSVFFPKTCAGCGAIIDEDDELCDYCHEMLVRCDPLKRCMRCGLDKKNCQCKRRTFAFEMCIAPFVNTSVAKRAMYYFKYRRKMTYGTMLAKQMALCVKNEYRGLKFDGICFVPMHRRKQLERGFNQTEVVAKAMSDMLEVPVINALKCVKYVRSQHELSEKQRLENVKNMYVATKNLRGKSILLVDDIKTTGATLNECTLQLLSAGADCVYCVTALIGEKKKDEKNKHK